VAWLRACSTRWPRRRTTPGAFTSVSLSGIVDRSRTGLDLNADEGRRIRSTAPRGGADAVHDGHRPGQRRPHGWHEGRLLAAGRSLANLTAGSGMPFTPVLSRACPRHRHRRIAAPESHRGLDDAAARVLLNPAAYTAPAPGEFGDAPRNSVSGPAQFSFDMSVARTFQLTSRLTLRLAQSTRRTCSIVRRSPVCNAVFGGPQFGLPSQVNTPA